MKAATRRSAPSTMVSAAAPGSPGVARLAWLDDLRGLAALAVVFHHYGFWALVPGGSFVDRHFDLGIYGVMVFFIISGWIIPASLHRRGDVRGFWIGRLWRIYPLVVVAVLLTALLPRGYSNVWRQVHRDEVWSFLANTPLLADFLGAPSALSVLWTLTFEMVFYYLATALFVLGRSHQAAPVAGAFTLYALLGGAIGGSGWLMSHWDSWHTRHVIIALTVLSTVLGLSLVLTDHRRPIRTGALLLAGMGLTLMATNARAPQFECGVILATMFAGTVAHELHSTRSKDGPRGRDRRRKQAVVLFVILGCALAGGLYNHGENAAQTWTETRAAFVLPYLAAWVTVWIGLRLSRTTWPRFLPWLGAISYSVYIVHLPVSGLVHWMKDTWTFFPDALTTRPALFAIRLAATLALATVTYRYVELPGQRVGRRIVTRLRTSRGADPAPAR